MPENPVGRASTAAMRAALAVGGVSVQYSQGGSVTTLRAVPGRTQFEAQTASGAIETVDSEDWSVMAADLPDVPVRGATISYDGKVWELMPSPDGRVYSKSDPNGIVLRLHTKRIE